MGQLLRRTVFVFLATVVGLEASLASLQYFRFSDLPVPRFSYHYPHYLVQSSAAFGVWHYPNFTATCSQSCFTFEFSSNSYGARDRERNKGAETFRTVVLGDSFVEGFGVNAEERFTDLLEAKTSIEHLNFGTSGIFGPTQYTLLYQHLAKQFNHSVVLVSIFPNNDFFDMDLDFARETYSDLYRPYLVGSYPEYQLTYYNRAYAPLGDDPAQFLHRFLYGFSYSYNAYLYWSRKTQVIKALAKRTSDRAVPENYSGYEDYTTADWDRLRYSLQMLLKETKGKQVVILTLPSVGELIRFQNENNRENRLNQALSEFSRQNGAHYLDLVPAFSDRPPRDFYLSCDGHWNSVGHAAAAYVDGDLSAVAAVNLAVVHTSICPKLCW